MKARAAMIIAHTMHRQSNKTRKFSECLREAWTVVKSGKIVPVIDLINKEGRRVKVWVSNYNKMFDRAFGIIKKQVEAAGCKVFGYENLLGKKPAKAPAYMSVPCPKCGTFCWGDCEA